MRASRPRGPGWQHCLLIMKLFNNYETLFSPSEYHRSFLGTSAFDDTINREQKRQDAKKLRDTTRANNEQQILEEMRASQGNDGLRNVLNKYFAFAVDSGKAKMLREVGKDVTVWDMSTFKEWCDNKPATVESIDTCCGSW